MYTQCPNCQQAFRVTAEILRQASGRVRCGSCAHVFDALDGLSEASLRTGAPDDEQERSFREVFEALDDGGNLRIEDTGVEWRVVEEGTGTDAAEEDDPSDASAMRWTLQDDPEEPQNDPPVSEADRRARQEPLELETPSAAEERYDDNTPLPGLLDDEEDDTPAIPEMPRRRAEDFIEPRSKELDERQVDFVLGDPEEWTDLLEEVGDTDDAAPAASARPDADEQRAEEPHSAADAPDDDADPTAEHPVSDVGALTLVDDDTAAADEHESLREPAGDMEEDLELVAESHVETIVMEGELVRSSLHGDVTPPEAGGETPLEQPAALKDTYIRARDARAGEESRGTAHYGRIAAAVLLGLSLAAQLVHAHRETLATYEVFNDTLGAVYRQLGAPITPDWNVNGWQFDDTRGSTDASDTALTISSRLMNRSPRTLPYPLLHVTLTDRYEEILGSELVEPAQYLAIRSARGMVDPGEDFPVTVTIAPLSADAAGFKLNVCYGIEGARVRCATGAFKH